VHDPVVIAAFRVREEASLAAALVKQAEMEVATYPYDDSMERLCEGGFASGFDLVVARADAADATALLQRMWREEGDGAPVAFARCPACGSLEVTRLRRMLLFAVAALMLLIGGAVTGERDLFALMITIVGGVLLFARPNRCRACGERWRGGDAPIADEAAKEVADVPCPRCGSAETARIPRRREKATTLLVNMLVPPLLFVWPFLPRRKCAACGHEWR
jgi:predicted RNA-binding Zn-ribbon protein involved in translation (DUF1610 family)